MITDILKDYYTEEEVAHFMGIAKKTLQINRCVGKNHPPCRKFGRVYRYPKREFHRWAESQELKTEIEASA